MKKILIVTCLSTVCICCMAQIQRKVTSKSPTDSLAPAPITGNAVGKRKEMLKELELDKQQKSKLKSMRQAAKQEQAAIEGDGELTDAQKKQRLQELRKRQMAQMDSVLTPEQKQKMLQMRRGAIKEKRGAKQAGEKAAGEMEIKDEQ